MSEARWLISVGFSSLRTPITGLPEVYVKLYKCPLWAIIRDRVYSRRSDKPILGRHQRVIRAVIDKLSWLSSDLSTVTTMLLF